MTGAFDVVRVRSRLKQAVGRRPPRYAPAPLLPRWRRADGNVAVLSDAEYEYVP